MYRSRCIEMVHILTSQYTEVVQPYLPKWSTLCTEMVMYRTGPTPMWSFLSLTAVNVLLRGARKNYCGLFVLWCNFNVFIAVKDCLVKVYYRSSNLVVEYRTRNWEHARSLLIRSPAGNLEQVANYRTLCSGHFTFLTFSGTGKICTVA